MGALHANPRVTIPIIIGSVPINQNHFPNPTRDNTVYQYYAPSAPVLDYKLPNPIGFVLSE
jgi:hypothetical protein